MRLLPALYLLALWRTRSKRWCVWCVTSRNLVAQNKRLNVTRATWGNAKRDLARGACPSPLITLHSHGRPLSLLRPNVHLRVRRYAQFGLCILHFQLEYLINISEHLTQAKAQASARIVPDYLLARSLLSDAKRIHRDYDAPDV